MTASPRPARMARPAFRAASRLALGAAALLGNMQVTMASSLPVAVPARPAAAPPPATVSNSEFSVESSGPSGVVLLWRNLAAGAGARRDRHAALALPAGASASAQIEILQAGPAPRFGNLAVTPAPVSLGTPARFRDATVAALTLHPLSAPAGKPALIGRARIRVSFGGNAARAGLHAFAPPPGNPSELFLRSWLVNYDQSRNFRVTEPAGLGKVAAGPSAGAALPKERLLIRTKGDNIEVLDYQALAKAGVPLGRINPRFMRLYQDGVEMPMYIQGEDDDRWDPGDYIEFMGRRPHGQGTFNSFYVATSTFVLAWDGGRMGLRAPAVPAARTGNPGDTLGEKTAPPFRVHEHQEEDNQILRIGSTSAEDVVDLGSHVLAQDLTDFWFWQNEGVEGDTRMIPLSLGFTPFVPSQEAGQGAATFRMTVNLKGITNNPNADPDHHVKFILNGHDISLIDGVENDAIWEGQESYTWTSAPLSPSVLAPGSNSLVIQKVNDLKTSDGQVVDVQDAYLNWVEMDFPATYAVRENRLAFSNRYPDSLGLTRFTLKGFTSPDVSLWDARGRKLVGYGIAPQGGTWSLSFLDSLSGPSDYLACSLDKREVPDIRLDTLTDLINPKDGADYIVVTGRDMLGSALDSLVAFRAAQGLRCKVVLADHIYQAFGDGSMDPAAIRAFAAYAYRAWPRPAPSYLALVGDASLWFEKNTGTTQKTIVPTHLVNVRGWGVAANDDFFGKVAGDDDVADLFVGRIPADTKEDLSKVVRKTLALEKDRPQGHWSNQALLIGGFESSFSLVNDGLQAIAAANDRQFSRLDLFPGSPYYQPAPKRIHFFDQLDSGFNLVSFVGHGGGAVWSDDGVLTLDDLDKGKLQGDYPVTLVSSVTCLTGYFEDVAARSLGEELLRLDRGGAAAFYGASGYISNLAGEALSAEVLRAATGNALGTVGAVINQAETMVKLQTGDAFSPILAEFNLLGDPALALRFPAYQGNLNVTPATLAGAAALRADGSGFTASGQGALSLYLGDSAESSTPVQVSGGAFSQTHAFGASVPAEDGKALVHVWNDKESQIASAPFTVLDWLIDSVALDPADASPSDSVRIRFRLSTPYAKTAFSGGIAAYVVGGEPAPLFPAENQTPLASDDGIHFATAGKIGLQPPAEDLSHPELHVAFRMNLFGLNANGDTVKVLSNLASRTYHLPLSDLARLSLHEIPFRLPVQDKLGVWVVFANRGLGLAQGFSVALTEDAEAATASTDTQTYASKLAFGQIDSLFFPLDDSLAAGKRLRAALVPARPGELAQQGTAHDTVFHVLTRMLGSPADTLRLDTSGNFATLAPGAAACRVFSEQTQVAALPPHLASPTGSLPLGAFRIRSRSVPALIVGRLAAATPKRAAVIPKIAAPASKAATSPLAAWHYQDSASGTWVKLDSAGPASDAVLAAAGFRTGLYAILGNSDVTPPAIQFSSRGQTLLPDDYVPLHTPIDIVIRDGQGVDLALHPPLMRSLAQSLDSATSASQSQPAYPLLSRLSFLPRHQTDRDSLEVIARDVSGNQSRRVIAYRLGDNLSIQNLGSYPNPFADTAIFAYSLTDFCDRVDLKIYSRAGRLVRALQEKNVVGYRETVWDGRADNGHNIANGLYFLKVTATAGDKEATRIFKLFKKQRK